MSAGMRSGVNCTRPNSSSSASRASSTSSVFARPGTPTKQAVAAREQRDQQLLDDLLLTDDPAVDRRDEPRSHLAQRLEELSVVPAFSGERGGGSVHSPVPSFVLVHPGPLLGNGVDDGPPTSTIPPLLRRLA